MADDVYNTEQHVSGVDGWRNISHSSRALSHFGLAPGDLVPHGQEGLAARVYVPEQGQAAKPQVVFRGTRMSSKRDWMVNADQAAGTLTDYHAHAARIGGKLAQAGADVEFVGHSLGGGLAQVAAMKFGGMAAAGADSRVTTFDAAGVHPRVLGELTQGDAQPLELNVAIDALHIEGEALTSIQRNTELPGAYGKSVAVQRPRASLSAVALPVVDKVLGRRTGLLVDKLLGHRMTPMITSLEQILAQTKPDAATPLKPRMRHDSVPPFGYLCGPPRPLSNILRPFHRQPQERQKLLDALRAEARFVLAYAAHQREHIGMPRYVDTQELAAAWNAVLPRGMPSAQRAERLDKLERRALRMLDELDARAGGRADRRPRG